MGGEASRNAALGRHDEDIDIPIILRGEGDQLSIRGEVGMSLGAGPGRQALGIPAVAADGPEVAGIGEDDPGLAQGRLPHEQRAGYPTRPGRRGAGMGHDDEPE